MHEVVQIKLREAGKIAYFDVNQSRPMVGEYVIVEAERGVDYGEVISELEMVLEGEIESCLRKILRVATREDILQIRKNRRKSKGVFNVCSKKIKTYKLDIKLIDAEYLFDRSKIIFYFTSEGRIDFRELVKDLAKIFKSRIEMRQIGVRDEAKMLGGFGPCGRRLCCATYLKDFEPVTIRMAKDQNLQLTPDKISGACGRLMCCLGYEYKIYKKLLLSLPKEGELVELDKGIKARVITVNPLTQKVLVETEVGKQIQLDKSEIKYKSKIAQLKEKLKR